MGIYGKNSSLFFHAVEAAKSSKVHTFIGENVPNLIHVNGGQDFKIVINTLSEAGYAFISWRTLNAREFGLPQDRDRIFLIASKDRLISRALHRPIDVCTTFKRGAGERSSGFYWTGGKRSICFSEGYVPTIKVGASPPKGGTSPIAVHYEQTVRKLSASECLRLQGFDTDPFEGLVLGSVFRMAGNAVPRPMGRFAAQSVYCASDTQFQETSSEFFSRDGFYDGYQDKIFSVNSKQAYLASNLDAFIDFDSTDSLSNQAAAGLIVRMIRSNKRMPISLFDTLYELSLKRTALRGTTVNSFEILHESLDACAYRATLI
jgi:hypothetical protein